MTLIDKMQSTVESIVENIKAEENTAVESTEVKEVELEDGLVVHCTTQAQVTSLLTYYASKGLRWISGEIATDYNPYPNRREATAIEIIDGKVAYGSIKYYRIDQIDYGYKILEFEDLGIELLENITYDLQISELGIFNDEVWDEELATEEKDFFYEQLEIMRQKYGDENVEHIEDDKWYQVTILSNQQEKFEKRLEVLENGFEELQFYWNIKEEV